MRFSGFTDEWVSYKIGDISKTYSGGTPSTSKREYYEGNIPFIKSGEIGNEVTEQYINEEAINNSSAKKVQKGDLLLALYGATSGEVAISKIDGAINQAVLKIDNKMNNYFQYNYFVKYKDQIIHKYLQGGQGNLSANIIKKLEFYYPNLEEQQKISNYLLLIDNKIELLEKKHHEYQNFKKYLMQQIFAQKLRFKSADGEQYSDWKERNLYEFLTEHKLKSTGNEEVYSVSVHKGLVNQKEHLGRDFSAPDTSKYNLVKPGDIVYTKSPTGDFPLGIIKQSRVDKNVIVSPLYGVFTPETYALGYILNDYFESNVNTHNYLHPIVQKGAKNTMNITNKTFLSKTLFVPTDVNEQQKIAECFSKVNDSIRNIEIQQNKVNEFKKGLLQQMFVVRINWRCNFKLAKSPSFNKHLLILKNKIIFIIIK